METPLESTQVSLVPKAKKVAESGFDKKKLEKPTLSYQWDNENYQTSLDDLRTLINERETREEQARVEIQRRNAAMTEK